MVNESSSLLSRAAPAVRGAHSIARELQQAITSGVFAYHQQLPTERQLALTFGASRTTVRKALTSLEAQKLVERRAGSGTYVSYQADAKRHDLAESTSPLELIEVRAAIEPQMARLAVLHASARDVERLQALVRELEAAEQDCDSERYSATDAEFHTAVASCTSNPLLIWLYEKISAVRSHAQWAEMRQKIITSENMRLYNVHHAAVVRAIQSRDAAAAAETMVQHMEKARSDLVGARSR